jgi:hypothetical protein
MMNSMECDEGTRAPQACRQAWHILALACRHVRISWQDRTTGTDRMAIRSRSPLCAVLNEAGYSLARIGQILQQPYSVLAHEGSHLATLVVPIARGEGDLADLTDIHRAVLAGEIVQELEGVLAPGEREAVSRSLHATLFGRTRPAGPEVIWGLWVLCAHPEARAVVDEVLGSWGLRAYWDLIDLQPQRAGPA